MTATNNTREQQLRTVTAVMRAVPEAEQRTVLEALFAEPRVIAPRGFRGRAPRDPSTYQPCGTEAAYQRHRAHGEPIDEACRKAASKTRSESQKRVRARRRAEAEAAAKAVA